MRGKWGLRPLLVAALATVAVTALGPASPARGALHVKDFTLTPVTQDRWNCGDPLNFPDETKPPFAQPFYTTSDCFLHIAATIGSI